MNKLMNIYLNGEPIQYTLKFSLLLSVIYAHFSHKKD